MFASPVELVSTLAMACAQLPNPVAICGRITCPIGMRASATCVMAGRAAAQKFAEIAAFIAWNCGARWASWVLASAKAAESTRTLAPYAPNRAGAMSASLPTWPREVVSENTEPTADAATVPIAPIEDARNVNPRPATASAVIDPASDVTEMAEATTAPRTATIVCCIPERLRPAFAACAIAR